MIRRFLHDPAALDVQADVLCWVAVAAAVWSMRYIVLWPLWLPLMIVFGG